jgi:uncharacterized circularly permuted ATP-grasp superfamily protein
MRNSTGSLREPYIEYHQWLAGQDTAELLAKSKEAEALFRRTGATFNVYSEEMVDERLLPFDVVPRVLSAAEWSVLSAGLEQRVRALNAFLGDLYNRQEILRAGRIPTEMIADNEAFLPNMVRFTPPGGVYTHIAGVDVVRTGPGEFFVLEDNVRTPSGVSYMLENRETMLHMFPELFSQIRVRDVSSYPQHLRQSLMACAPAGLINDPVVAVLTPGIFNSAYFEHAFLADNMGAELVTASDLGTTDGRLTMRTTAGDQPIDVLYRRVDDDFLDPLNFNPSSLLGVPGVMDIYRAGRLTIANAPGTGIADDKAIYSYMPEIIRFYTGESPILSNIPTRRCADPDDLRYVVEHLEELVVKEVHGSGGYGMLIGPTSSKAEIASFRAKLESQPENYIAQPTLSLSAVPVLTEAGLAPRHVDLRPFVLVSTNGVHITPGGLTRVALTEGSLVVNSSQGGGTKDTWVLDAR